MILVVRSSAANEDGWNDSQAGAHLSLTDIPADPTELKNAINQVFGSYRVPTEKDEVLVQPMVIDVALSGVILTRDLDTGGPYYSINYDDLSGRTDTVTGGQESKTVFVHRTHPDRLHSHRLRKLIECTRELEEVTGSEELDIEFCITKNDDVYILQVRPLAARRRWLRIEDVKIDNAIESIRTKISTYMQGDDELAGDTTVFGEMPDWNPAEIIGNTPRPLAMSLYKNLITDSTWAQARADMGYRHVKQPLLIDLYGRPFIDVRLSFNSFLPARLDENVAQKLINHQLEMLFENRELHDKIEFEIAITCRNFSFDRHRSRLLNAGLKDGEINHFDAVLTDLTRNILTARDQSISVQLAKLAQFENGPVPDMEAEPKNIGRLLDKCRQFGTLPFSILARHGFIAILFLKSLCERGVMDQEEIDHFLRSIDTVATRLVNDLESVNSNQMDPNDFLSRYGHLRPGTYDITSWRYDEKPKLYLGQGIPETKVNQSPFILSQKQKAEIKILLGDLNLDINADELFRYISDAVKAREEAKFGLSRNLSDALQLTTQWGDTHGLSREDLSYLQIPEILASKDGDELLDIIAKREEEYILTRALRLPHLICELDDIDIIRLPLGQPTFITGKAVTARGVNILSHTELSIRGKIVLIESTDPGYDWIFTHNIAGLITKYGGANSHMAIRSAEFGLPAAIGCGERLFETLVRTSVIELNCAARKISGH